jgi:hypothetical protein
LQKLPEEKKKIVVMDGFDEVCPDFRNKVLALIKKTAGERIEGAHHQSASGEGSNY